MSEIEEKYKNLQNDYYSLIDKYEDLKEKYSLAKKQNDELFLRYEAVIAENKKLNEMLKL